MHTAYRFRVYPDPEQESVFRRTFGCIRVVWNELLRRRQDRWAATGKVTSYAEADKMLTAMKGTPEYGFLYSVCSAALQQAVRHQQRAFVEWGCKRARFPRPKRESARQTAHFTRRSGFRIKATGLWFAKTATPLRVAWSWPDVDMTSLDPSMAVVTLEADGRWFVTLKVTREDPKPLESTGETIGVDLGITTFATLSSGDKKSIPRSARRERGIRRQQKRLARTVPGSNNHEKQRKRFARKHSKVKRQRKDAQHKLSSDLVRRFDVIAIEDLRVENMRKNRKLARAISACGWGEFRRQLEYKAERAGRRIVAVDAFFPSTKTCSGCGYVLASLSLRTRHWTCPECGTRHDRDINAAKNIPKAAGLVVSACGEDVRLGVNTKLSSLKQEACSVRTRSP